MSYFVCIHPTILDTWGNDKCCVWRLASTQLSPQEMSLNKGETRGHGGHKDHRDHGKTSGHRGPKVISYKAQKHSLLLVSLVSYEAINDHSQEIFETNEGILP